MAREFGLCPNCDEPLLAFELEGIEIDHCIDCKGTWLDLGELALLGEIEGTEPGGLSQAMLGASKGAKSRRRCPRCNRRLRIEWIGEANPVEVDRCPHGDGLWLDRGELRAIVSQFTDGEEGVVARFLGDLHRDELKTESKGE